MKKYIYLLLSVSMVLMGCGAIEQTLEIEGDGFPTVSIFSPGYETFDEVVDDSNLIIRGRILDERIEYVNVHITLEEAILAREGLAISYFTHIKQFMKCLSG